MKLVTCSPLRRVLIVREIMSLTLSLTRRGCNFLYKGQAFIMFLSQSDHLFLLQMDFFIIFSGLGIPL